MKTLNSLSPWQNCSLWIGYPLEYRNLLFKLVFVILQPIAVNSPETTLADLLDLQLHAFEDEVKNIVDKAVKEMSMEKTIKVRTSMRIFRKISDKR